MSFYCILIAVIATGSFLGYQSASNDLLQQIFWGRKLCFLLTVTFCMLPVIAILLVCSPNLLVSLIPVAVGVLYATICVVLRLIFKKFDGKCSPEFKAEFTETALRTGVSVNSAIEIALFLFSTIMYLSGRLSQLAVDAVSPLLCHGLLLGIAAMLLMASVHYIIVLRVHPSTDDCAGKSLLQLRKELRSFPMI